MEFNNIKKINDMYDDYLEYSKLLEQAKEYFNMIYYGVSSSLDYRFNYVLRQAEELDNINFKIFKKKDVDVSKHFLDEARKEYFNELHNYWDLIRKFNLLLINLENKFVKLKDYLSKEELDEYLRLRQIINNFSNVSEDCRKSLDESFEKYKGRRLKDFFDVAKKNWDMLIGDCKDIDDGFKKIEDKIKLLKPKELGIDAIFKNNGKMMEKDGVLVVDDAPFNGQERYVDVSFDKNLSLDSLVMVHATDYFPDGHIIKSNKNDGSKHEIDINGKKMNFTNPRDTVHFAINGRVGSHNNGNWDAREIIVIEPLSEHIKELENFNVVDTWIRGNVELSKKAILLVKDERYNLLSEEQKNEYNIIRFRGNSTICVQKVLLMLGYKPQNVLMNSWSNEDFAFKVGSFLVDNYSVRIGSHFNSNEHNLERNMHRRDKYLSIIRNEQVNVLNGGSLEKKEVLKLFTYYMLDRSFNVFSIEKLFAMFIRDYGICFREGRYFMLADHAILKERDEEEIKKIIDDCLGDLKKIEENKDEIIQEIDKSGRSR